MRSSRHSDGLVLAQPDGGYRRLAGHRALSVDGQGNAARLIGIHRALAGDDQLSTVRHSDRRAGGRLQRALVELDLQILAHGDSFLDLGAEIIAFTSDKLQRMICVSNFFGFKRRDGKFKQGVLFFVVCAVLAGDILSHKALHIRLDSIAGIVVVCAEVSGQHSLLGVYRGAADESVILQVGGAVLHGGGSHHADSANRGETQVMTGGAAGAGVAVHSAVTITVSLEDQA